MIVEENRVFMLTKAFLITAFLMFSSIQLLAQISYKGVVPGTTTRAQVEHAFGQAVKEVSSTLSEYEAGDVAGKIYVQFRSGADVVERVEVIYQDPNDRSKVAVSLKLPPRPTASQVNSKGKREEYYAANCIVLTFAGESLDDGVSRVGYYSRELFDGANETVSVNVRFVWSRSPLNRKVETYVNQRIFNYSIHTGFEYPIARTDQL